MYMLMWGTCAVPSGVHGDTGTCAMLFGSQGQALHCRGMHGCIGTCHQVCMLVQG